MAAPYAPVEGEGLISPPSVHVLDRLSLIKSREITN